MQRTHIARRVASFALALGSALIGAGGLSTTAAHAAVPEQLPYMCFNTSHTFHQLFGPDSFFLSGNQQGPTGFQEDPPTSKPVVTLPLRRGTAAGHLVYYAITDASDQAVARALGVNFVPKLANAAGSSAVQLSSSSDPAAIDVPAGVDFSPTRVLVPGPDGFPPAQAQPGAVGNLGYSPLVQLPSGVVINAPQIGDGATTNAADKTHWADKVESVDPVSSKLTYDITNGCYEDQSVHYVSFDSSIAPAAAIEDVTLAPALGGVPFQECGTNDINVTTSPFINPGCARSEEHTSELQSPAMLSYAVFCLRMRPFSTSSRPSTSWRTCPTAEASSTTARCGTSTSSSGTLRCLWPTVCGRPTSPGRRRSSPRRHRASLRMAPRAARSRQPASSSTAH